IGARGMAWIWDEDGERVMQPQTGGVIIEEDCILGTGIAIVRGSLSENTIIGKGTVMAHGTKIGHGCVVGQHVHFANNVSLAGNAILGDRVFLGSGCVVSSNVKIGEGCIVGAGAVVHKSIEENYCTVAGVPATIIKRNNFESKPKGAPRPFRSKK
ncbi:MAG TPA: DapH/DapD/GlmU-related protein, partial [Bacteroidia bacterium]|nr:DapH/DapD/GlmU-related protein [Bacteroidia bacterium]